MYPYIFYEGIITPPSEIGAIRNLMLYSDIFLRKQYEFILETEPENKDIYYNWLKMTYLYDYIKEIITTEENVKGLRIAETKTKSPFVVVERVTFNNFNEIVFLLF